MATKRTITPREAFLSSHLHGGVVAEQRQRIRRAAPRPIRTICAWCASHDKPAAVLVDVPLDDRGLSHGICPSCCSSLRARTSVFTAA